MKQLWLKWKDEEIKEAELPIYEVKEITFFEWGTALVQYLKEYLK